MRWIVSLSIVLMAMTACGGSQVPAHNGYKPKETKPWRKPKALKFDEKLEAKADGDVSYPEMRRARWFEVTLPTDGQLSLTLEIVPGDAISEEFDLGLEVLDPSFRVISKSDLEDEDAHEQLKKKTLVELAPGKYLIHIFLQGRMDSADFVLRAAFKATAAAEAKTNFPAEVPFVPVLAMVPLQDDTPRNYMPKTQAVVKVFKKPREPKEPPKVEAATVSARIIAIQVVAGGTLITVGRGKASGASDGMKAKINGISGGFVIGNCNDRTCTATVAATPDQIKNSNGLVTLSP